MNCHPSPVIALWDQQTGKLPWVKSWVYGAINAVQLVVKLIGPEIKLESPAVQIDWT